MFQWPRYSLKAILIFILCKINSEQENVNYKYAMIDNSRNNNGLTYPNTQNTLECTEKRCYVVLFKKPNPITVGQEPCVDNRFNNSQPTLDRDMEKTIVSSAILDHRKRNLCTHYPNSASSYLNTAQMPYNDCTISSIAQISNSPNEMLTVYETERHGSPISECNNNGMTSENSNSNSLIPKEITLTRIVTQITTKEQPITLYREVTTTVTSEKPIINFKVTTITEESISTKTISTTDTITETSIKTKISTEERTETLTTVKMSTQFLTETKTITETVTKPISDIKTITEEKTISIEKPEISTTVLQESSNIPQKLFLNDLNLKSKAPDLKSQKFRENDGIIHKTETIDDKLYPELQNLLKKLLKSQYSSEKPKSKFVQSTQPSVKTETITQDECETETTTLTEISKESNKHHVPNTQESKPQSTLIITKTSIETETYTLTKTISRPKKVKTMTNTIYRYNESSSSDSSSVCEPTTSDVCSTVYRTIYEYEPKITTC